MKQRIALILKKTIILLVVASAVIGGLIYWLFFDINRIPEGELIVQVESPSGEFSLKVYLVNGGATVSYSIRGELVYNHRTQRPKNIYWQYREESASVEWIDNYTVNINGHIIDVRYQVYDWRRAQ